MASAHVPESIDPATAGRYVAELVESSTVLDSLESAAAAEAWVSGAITEWAALGGDPIALPDRIGDGADLARRMIEWILGGEPPSFGPDWVSDIGRYHAVRAAQISTGDESAFIVEFSAPSGDRHSASVSSIDGMAVDITIGPEDLIDATESTRLFTLELVDVAEAAESIRTALTSTSWSALTEDGALNLPALARRFSIPLEQTMFGRLRERTPAGSEMVDRAPVTPPNLTRNTEDDRYAAELLRSALQVDENAPPPAGVLRAQQHFRSLVEADDPDSLALLEVAGLVPRDPIDLGCYLQCVGAYLAPVSLTVHDVPAQHAIAELEWADWLGAVLGIARRGSDRTVDGTDLVSLINHCPEITTKIPSKDQPRIAWAFEQVLYAWELTGVIDGEGSVTDAGVWVVPRAALTAWR